MPSAPNCRAALASTAVSALARAVDGDDVARLEHLTAHPQLAGRGVDVDLARAGDAGPAHAAGDHRRVAGHAAPRGDDAASRVHAADVLRAGLVAHQDDRVFRPPLALGGLGGEDDVPCRGAG
jgi:hypothetical protein